MAELVRMAEGRVLRRDLAPHVPASAGFDLGIERGRLVLGAHRCVLHTAAIGDEHQVVFSEVDEFLLAFGQQLDALGQLLVGLDFELDVDHLGVVVELHAVGFQVPDHRQDHGLVLVILGEAQRGEVRQAADVVDVALEVELHLQRAVPVFKGEHRAPVEPEVGIQDLVVEEVGDALVVELLVGGEEQAHDLHGRLVGEVELAVGVGVFAALDGGTAKGVVGILLVQIVVLVQNAQSLGLNGRNGAEQVPHDLEVVVHLAPAAHDVAQAEVLEAVAGAAGDGILFEDVNVLSGHLTVAHQETGCGQRRQAGADDIRGLAVHTLGLEGTNERFVIAVGIIH